MQIFACASAFLIDTHIFRVGLLFCFGGYSLAFGLHALLCLKISEGISYAGICTRVTDIGTVFGWVMDHVVFIFCASTSSLHKLLLSNFKWILIPISIPYFHLLEIGFAYITWIGCELIEIWVIGFLYTVKSIWRYNQAARNRLPVSGKLKSTLSFKPNPKTYKLFFQPLTLFPKHYSKQYLCKTRHRLSHRKGKIQTLHLAFNTW